MTVRFFLYDKHGEIFCRLPAMPENMDTFDDPRGDIWFDGRRRVAGINWDVVEWEYSDVGVELDGSRDYRYNSNTGEFEELEEDDDLD